MPITSSLFSPATGESSESLATPEFPTPYTKSLVDKLAPPAAKAIYAIHCPIGELTPTGKPPKPEEEGVVRNGAIAANVLAILTKMGQFLVVPSDFQALKMEWETNVPVSIATALQSSEPVILEGLRLLAHFLKKGKG